MKNALILKALVLIKKIDIICNFKTTRVLSFKYTVLSAIYLKKEA
jgi:hypothetical protein